MSEHKQTIDDAKRYTDLVTAGGWKDPEVDPIKMLADVLEAHEIIVDEERDEVRKEGLKEHDEQIKAWSKEFRAVLAEIGVRYDSDDLDGLIKELGEHYRSTTRAEVEAAEGKAEEAERARIELEEKLATIEHELLHARDQLKEILHHLGTFKGERKALAKGSPTRKRSSKARGGRPTKRKR